MTAGPRVTLERTANLRRSWPLLCRCATWPVLLAAACGPLAVAGCVAAAQVAWMLPLAVSAAGAVVSGSVALLFARHRRLGRLRTTALAGCLLAAWWAQAAVVILPLAAPWGLLVAGLAGLAGVAIVLARARHRLRESRDAWRLAAAFVTEPRRYQRAVLRGTSGVELCRMWDEAGRDMGRVVQPDVLWDYLELRRLLLGELERRDPVVFARWLEHADATHIRECLVHRAG